MTQGRPRRQAPRRVWLTIDGLARSAGTTTRSVRAFQARGLLPRPHLVGRTGYYDEDHLARLRAALRLQERGFSVAAIRELLAAWEEGLTLEGVLGLAARRRRRAGEGEPDDYSSVELPRRQEAALALIPGPLLRLVRGEAG